MGFRASGLGGAIRLDRKPYLSPRLGLLTWRFALCVRKL